MKILGNNGDNKIKTFYQINYENFICLQELRQISLKAGRGNSPSIFLGRGVSKKVKKIATKSKKKANFKAF